MPVSRNAHHAQLFATPFSRTRFVTRLGVSVLNVVATIEKPISHQGAARPDVKNSAVLDPARFARRIAGMNDTTIETTTMIQSSVVTFMPDPRRGSVLRTAEGKRVSECQREGQSPAGRGREPTDFAR